MWVFSATFNKKYFNCIVGITFIGEIKPEIPEKIINIQLMTFDKVDTMIYRPRRSDNDGGQWPR